MLYSHNASESLGSPPAQQRRAPRSLRLGPILGVRWFLTLRLGVLAEGGYIYSTRQPYADLGWGGARLDAHSSLQATFGIAIRLGSVSPARSTP